MQDVFDMCSQHFFFAAHFGVVQPRDNLAVASCRSEPWRVGWPGAAALGLEFPVGHLFQDLDVECLIRNQWLETSVLALQFFQALHRVAVGGSVLRSLSMQCHQRHAKRFRDISKRLSLRQRLVSFSQLRHDLFWSVAFPIRCTLHSKLLLALLGLG
jgi:hypothetical protein